MDLELPERKKRGGTCTMKRIFAAAGEKDRAKIETWLADPDIEHVQIAQAISGKFKGIEISDSTVGRHRNKECRCER